MIISAGNHDYFYEKSLYNRVEWSPNVFIFRGGNSLEKIEFPDLNTIIYGYSWDRVEIRENNLFHDFNIEEDNDFNKILLIHGDIGTKSNYLPLNLSSLKKN